MATYRITGRDFVTRTKLETASLYRYVVGVKTIGSFLIPSEYKLKFLDNFVGDGQLNGEDASTGGAQPYHPGMLTQGFDPNQVKNTLEGIQFSAVQKPRTFDGVEIPNAVGIVRMRQPGKYGIFSFRAKLPKGTYLGPALGLSGAINGPPEIDLLEGYSDDTVDYHGNTCLQSNVHMKDGSTGDYAAGARTHRLPNSVTDEMIYYTVWGEKDFIRMYYNRYLVREITDRKILDAMSEAQNIIIGTGVQEGFNKNNISPLIVERVAIYQKS